jgi:sulfotransferase
MHDYYFISGLPRSGSTLLSAILRQNPEIYADITSPVEAICSSTIDILTEDKNNFIIKENQRISILQHIFEGFYSEIKQPIIFDTSRVWSKKIPLLQTLFPKTKLLCCIRDIVDILNSFEVIFNRNPLYKNTLIKQEELRHYVFSRCESLMNFSEGIIGTNLLNLQEGYYAHPEMMYLVEYETLCRNPKETMTQIYEFLSLPYYEHDFENLEYKNEPFDVVCNLKDLHTVKKRVEYNPPKMILPPEVIDKYSSTNMEFWKKSSKNSVKTLISYK